MFSGALRSWRTDPSTIGNANEAFGLTSGAAPIDSSFSQVP
jgi:hypothetical protein